MPKGPQGQKRPTDIIGNAIKVARIATGEEVETLTQDGKDKAVQVLLHVRERHALPRILLNGSSTVDGTKIPDSSVAASAHARRLSKSSPT